MCACTPSIRTPWCRRGRCVPPGEAHPPNARVPGLTHDEINDIGRKWDCPEEHRLIEVGRRIARVALDRAELYATRSW
jgi:hypothetical protein